MSAEGSILIAQLEFRSLSRRSRARRFDIKIIVFVINLRDRLHCANVHAARVGALVRDNTLLVYVGVVSRLSAEPLAHTQQAR